MLERIENFVDGQFVAPIDGQYMPTYNPATGKVYMEVPDSSEHDLNLAVEAAKRAFPSWSSTPRLERQRILLLIADLIDRNLDELSSAESRDQGKPVSFARQVDIPRARDNFRFFAGKLSYVQGKCSELESGHSNPALSYTQQMPVGVAGLISPWNLPLYLLTWKIAPCIAYGNTCVCKPSEFTSVTACMLCLLMKEAGLPDGVVNMVFGTGPRVGAALVKHPNVPLISFTGGTVTGERVIVDSAKHFKKLSLELGGKNANIIFNDADLERCVETSVRSSYSNQGEICLCGSRIFVQESIVDRFVEMFLERVRKLHPADPSDPKTKLGALVSEQHLEKVLGYIRIAREEGCQILHGSGQRRTDIQPVSPNTADLSAGYFMDPTIIMTNHLDPMKCRVTQEEIFGPVVTITPFSTEQQVLDWANGTQYGLSASLWTEDAKRQRRVAEKLRVGTVWVNCWLVRDLNMPFGGMKASGLGREGGDYSEHFFTEEKTICLSNL